MIIFGSPGRYIQGPGILDRIGEEVGRLGKSAVLVADTVVDRLVGGRVAASCDAAGVTLRNLSFGGEITPGEIDRHRRPYHAAYHEALSAEIGRLVMEALKGLDDVAYVRFASVYRNFREAKDFHDVLGELKADEDAG